MRSRSWAFLTSEQPETTQPASYFPLLSSFAQEASKQPFTLLHYLQQPFSWPQLYKTQTTNT